MTGPYPVPSPSVVLVLFNKTLLLWTTGMAWVVSGPSPMVAPTHSLNQKSRSLHHQPLPVRTRDARKKDKSRCLSILKPNLLLCFGRKRTKPVVYRFLNPTCCCVSVIPSLKNCSYVIPLTAGLPSPPPPASPGTRSRTSKRKRTISVLFDNTLLAQLTVECRLYQPEKLFDCLLRSEILLALLVMESFALVVSWRNS